MRPFLLLFLVLTTLALTTQGCSKDDDREEEYLIFGHFYGLCWGTEVCVETFQLTRSALYEDTNDLYPGTGPYQFLRLSKEKHRQVKELLGAIPDELFQFPAIIGCPDCYDQGGVRIEYFDGHIVRRWQIDKARSAIPQELLPFVELIEEKITYLN